MKTTTGKTVKFDSLEVRQQMHGAKVNGDGTWSVTMQSLPVHILEADEMARVMEDFGVRGFDPRTAQEVYWDAADIEKSGEAPPRFK